MDLVSVAQWECKSFLLQNSFYPINDICYGVFGVCQIQKMTVNHLHMNPEPNLNTAENSFSMKHEVESHVPVSNRIEAELRKRQRMLKGKMTSTECC